MYKTERDKKRIKEFLDLADNDHYTLPKYSHPVLVYELKDEMVNYSLWEEDMLERFGLKNVDGYDYQTDVLFCPDWVAGEDEDDDDFDDDDDDI